MNRIRLQSIFLVCAALMVAVAFSSLMAEPIRSQKQLDSLIISKELSANPKSAYKTGGFDNWSPAQATGVPNTKSAGDQVTAWASRTQDEQKEWLELTYEKPVSATTIMIYETYNPGAISKVEFWRSDNKGSGFWIGDVGVIDQQKRILMVRVPENFGEFDRVKLYLDSPAVPGWNEIDAVGLLGEDGKTHWAKSAKASSSYSELYTGITHSPALSTNSDSEIKKLKKEIDQLKARIDKLEKAINARPIPWNRTVPKFDRKPTPSKSGSSPKLKDPPAAINKSDTNRSNPVDEEVNDPNSESIETAE